MATELRIPKLGMSTTEATLQEWLVADGAQVEPGTPIYTLETDKSVTEVEAQDSGVLRQLGQVDETYEVGTLIGTIEP
jgi:pyruvate/2-oxoglutarate dehydrogenase complex dihydrolipoamide acyltransferase (E2) component